MVQKLFWGQIKEILNQHRCKDDWIKVDKVHKKRRSALLACVCILMYMCSEKIFFFNLTITAALFFPL